MIEFIVIILIIIVIDYNTLGLFPFIFNVDERITKLNTSEVILKTSAFITSNCHGESRKLFKATSVISGGRICVTNKSIVIKRNMLTYRFLIPISDIEEIKKTRIILFEKIHIVVSRKDNETCFFNLIVGKNLFKDIDVYELILDEFNNIKDDQ